MKRYVLAVAAVMGMVLATGCSTRIGNLTTVSTRNVRGITYNEKGRVRGKNCSHIVLIFPFGSPDLQDAIDDTMNKGRGDMLVDAIVYKSGWYIPAIYGQSCYEVEGTVVDSMEVTKKKEIKDGE